VEVLMRQREAQERLEAAMLDLQAVAQPGGGLGQRATQAAAHVPHELAQRVSLAGEVEVEGALSHAGAPRYRRDGATGEPVLTDLGLGGFKQSSSGCLAPSGARVGELVHSSSLSLRVGAK